MADWTQLPPELLETISVKLTIYSDYLHLRAVCKTWYTIVPKIPKHLPPQLPWLMFPPSSPDQTHRAFFDLSAHKFHFFNLPEASRGKRLCGSSHGWLTILDDSPTVLLLNPLTRDKLCLPPLWSFPFVVGFNYSNIGREYVLYDMNGDIYSISLRKMRDLFLKKVVLSSSPLGVTEFSAVAILDQTGDLAFCRRNDRSWKIVEDARSFSEDVIWCDGLFYAVNKDGKIAVLDAGSDIPLVSFIETTKIVGGDMHYLVSFGNELLLVTRFLDLELALDPSLQPNLIYKTMGFEVFKLNHDERKWEKITCLGDRVLFLGGNSSLSLLASDFPGCMRNCIYYTDDYSETNYEGHFGEHDMGIFNLADETIELLPCFPQGFHSQIQWPSPVWVSPSPC